MSSGRGWERLSVSILEWPIRAWHPAPELLPPASYLGCCAAALHDPTPPLSSRGAMDAQPGEGDRLIITLEFLSKIIQTALLVRHQGNKSVGNHKSPLILLRGKVVSTLLSCLIVLIGGTWRHTTSSTAGQGGGGGRSP